MAHQYCNCMDASFIYLWYGCNNVAYSSYDTYIHVFRRIHMDHIIKWDQIVLMGHVGHMVHMGHVGHVALLVHMVRVGHVLHMRMKNMEHLLQMLCVGHMLHMSPISKWFTYQWTFQMNINTCLQMGPKIK